MNISRYHFTHIIALTISAYGFSQHPMKKMEPVSFSQVNITDQFWKPKIDMVATKTLDACIYQTEIKTARIRNFEKVARNQGEKHEGIPIPPWKKNAMSGSIELLPLNSRMDT
jgi:uncharacterized protein